MLLHCTWNDCVHKMCYQICVAINYVSDLEGSIFISLHLLDNMNDGHVDRTMRLSESLTAVCIELLQSGHMDGSRLG